MKKCIFCKIINNEMHVERIWENKDLIAIFDTNPVSRIHILILPKIHIENFNKIEKSFFESLIKCVKYLIKNFKIKKSGYRLIINIGKDSGQEIKHIHFHLIGGEKLKSLG